MPTGRLSWCTSGSNGRVEIEAKDTDQAWELARTLSPRDLADGDPLVTVAIEYLDSQESQKE